MGPATSLISRIRTSPAAERQALFRECLVAVAHDAPFIFSRRQVNQAENAFRAACRLANLSRRDVPQGHDCAADAAAVRISHHAFKRARLSRCFPGKLLLLGGSCRGESSASGQRQRCKQDQWNESGEGVGCSEHPRCPGKRQQFRIILPCSVYLTRLLPDEQVFLMNSLTISHAKDDPERANSVLRARRASESRLRTVASCGTNSCDRMNCSNHRNSAASFLLHPWNRRRALRRTVRMRGRSGNASAAPTATRGRNRSRRTTS